MRSLCWAGRVDTAVERLGKVCFDTCDQSDPRWKISDCYLVCYINTLVRAYDPHEAALGVHSARILIPSFNQSFVPNRLLWLTGWAGCALRVGLHDGQTGDPGYNISKTPPSAIVDPWVQGFTSDDPAEGGCPRVQPLPCKGPQCPTS